MGLSHGFEKKMSKKRKTYQEARQFNGDKPIMFSSLWNSGNAQRIEFYIGTLTPNMYLAKLILATKKNNKRCKKQPALAAECL